MPCYVNQYNCYYCVELCCVLVALIIPHKTRLFEVRRFKGLVAELCGPSDRHLVTLPLWQATWGLSLLPFDLVPCLGLPTVDVLTLQIYTLDSIFFYKILSLVNLYS